MFYTYNEDIKANYGLKTVKTCASLDREIVNFNRNSHVNLNKYLNFPEHMNHRLQQFISTKAWSYDLGLLALRLACSLMLLHGWSKFTDFSEGSKDWPDPFHVGATVSYALTVFAELFCSVFVVLGLFTRFALIPLIICLFVIVFEIHGGDPLEDREHGLLFLLAYLSLLFTGPGKFSLDSLIEKKLEN